MKSSVKQKVDEFFSSYSEKRFSKGQILIYAGDDPPGVFYLTHGQIKQYDINKAGNEIVVNSYKEPAIVPASWVINRTKNRYFYESFTDITVRIAPVSEVETFLKNNPDVMYDLLQRVYAGIEDVLLRMMYLMGGSTRKRVIAEILLDCKRYGIRRSDGSYVLNLHEAEIAARAGLARETVSRHLSQIDHGKLVRISHKNIIVTDLSLLEKELGDGLA